MICDKSCSLLLVCFFSGNTFKTILTLVPASLQKASLIRWPFGPCMADKRYRHHLTSASCRLDRLEDPMPQDSWQRNLYISPRPPSFVHFYCSCNPASVHHKRSIVYDIQHQPLPRVGEVKLYLHHFASHLPSSAFSNNIQNQSCHR